MIFAAAATVLAAVGSTAAQPASTLGPNADTEPPSVPQGMAFSGRTRTTVSLVWRAATDNVGVRGYRLFKNGRAVATVTGLRHTYRGLRCGTQFTFALEAYDAAGNASYRPEAVGTISTLGCAAAPKRPKSARPPARPTPPAGSTLANVWVDTNGGTCRRLAAAAAYVDARACGDVQAAYNTAVAGDVIVVTGGTYGRQVVPEGTKRVTIRNAAKSRPVFGTTSIRASNVSLIGIRIERNDDPGSVSATLEVRGSNNVLDRIDVDTKNMPKRQGIYARGDNNVFRNGSSFNVVDEKGAQVSGTNVTFDNMAFHDVKVTHPSVHNECVYSLGPGLTVRNSRFWNCATMDLFVTRGDWYGQPLYGNVTLENNVFGHTYTDEPGQWHYYSLGINGGVIQEMRNWRVVNNTFEIPASGGGTAAPGTIWANNVGDWSCYPGATFSGNVGKKCGPTDKAISPASSCRPPACAKPTSAQHWADPANHDFRLTVRSPAVNAADPKYAPRRDRVGRLRNGLPDAGAYEFWP